MAQKIGKNQATWLERIKEAGGSIEVVVHWTPVAMIKVDDGPDIRIPIREFEALFDRDLFEEIEIPGHKSLYRLKR